MGRWTVAEWQAQTQQYPFDPLPGGVGELGYGDEIYPHRINTVLDEKEGEFEDEEAGNEYGKPLPARPMMRTSPRSRPPTPPSKTTRPTTYEYPILVDRPPGGVVHKLFGALRKTGHTRGQRDTFGEARDESKYRRPRKGGLEFVMVTPARPPLRSPDGHRPREFLARSGLKRIKSRAKLDAPSKAAESGGGYMYHGQGLQVFVSTHTMATPSAPDAGRPRVFFPRSSSLAATRDNALPRPPSLPEAKSQNKPQPPRALPALPAGRGPDTATSKIHGRGSSKGSNSKSTGRIRPLPVPARAPISPL
ncbi:hypothetical protein DFH07DRAFT_945307 [Mycena maculata]|uniref:Uncharacterized protein n=1 Tax=Mycena maculata TaxID=230809 RepID=A0AAD7MSL2_9AGAR|nr:hypothetical protein DFH07DRAFT_945307 [Mycena maculata]